MNYKLSFSLIKLKSSYCYHRKQWIFQSTFLDNCGGAEVYLCLTNIPSLLECGKKIASAVIEYATSIVLVNNGIVPSKYTIIYDHAYGYAL